MKIFKLGFLLAISVVIAVPTFANETTYEVQKNFNVSPGGKLVVNINGGDIRVSVWDKAQVQMNADNIGDDADRVHAEQNGNTVTVDFRPRSGWWGNDRDVTFRFYVPREFSLDLTTSGGDIQTSGGITGDVLMTTSGGDLTIDKVNGKVDGKTSGGDVTVSDIGGDSHLVSSGGDIKIDRAGASLQVSTSGGNIVLGNAAGDVKAFTSGGDVQISKVGGSLQLSTSSGDISVGTVGGNATLSTSGGDISLTSANGQVTANTSGGDVDIRNVVGSVDAASSGGTVKVGLTPKGDGESRISSTGGDIYLFVPSDAGATIDAEVYGVGSDNEIVTDFPVTLQSGSGNYGTQRARLSLHGGGQRITLKTTSGTIYIKKMGSQEK